MKHSEFWNIQTFEKYIDLEKFLMKFVNNGEYYEKGFGFEFACLKCDGTIKAVNVEPVDHFRCDNAQCSLYPIHLSKTDFLSKYLLITELHAASKIAAWLRI